MDETEAGRERARAVLALLESRGLWLTTAESCSGGLLGHWLTEIPGSSRSYQGGVISYSNALKQQLLGVPEAMLEQYGAVSAETAAAMASGACARLGADLALAITGIAGPGGGSAEKPVGLVYLALAAPDGVRVERMLWADGDRSSRKQRSALFALQMAFEWLQAH